MRSRLWQQIYAAPGEREAIPNSGKTPDKTDDGVLWIDLSRPWLVEDLTFSIPVTRESGVGDAWTGESTNALFELLAALRQPEVLGEEAMRIKCKVSSRGHMGARAIVKCLALGVNP